MVLPLSLLVVLLLLVVLALLLLLVLLLLLLPLTVLADEVVLGEFGPGFDDPLDLGAVIALPLLLGHKSAAIHGTERRDKPRGGGERLSAINAD